MNQIPQQWQSSYRFPFSEYHVKHRTTYDYSMPVSLSYHNLHIKPKDWSIYQHISDFMMEISPEPSDFSERMDYFGNYAQSFSIQETHEQLVINTEFDTRIISNPPPTEEMTITCAQVRKALHGDTSFRTLNALQYIYASPLIPYSPKIATWAEQFFPEKQSFLGGVLELSSVLKRDIQFDPEATEINTSIEEFFELKKGVCQDFAHLMIACLRSQDLPARYVSGYILTFPPEGQKRMEGADASHAWVSVYIPGWGWVDIDPTNDLLVDDQHIRLAVGRDYTDVSPVKGSVTGGGETTVKVEVTVMPIETESGEIGRTMGTLSE